MLGLSLDFLPAVASVIITADQIFVEFTKVQGPTSYTEAQIYAGVPIGIVYHTYTYACMY
jgi:hypothetical protein